MPYNTTELERDLAVRLGIPMYGADPRHFPLGTKSGCRRLFEEEGVAHPLGRREPLAASTTSSTAIVATCGPRSPSSPRCMVKLNEGVSGEGNALVDLAACPTPGDADERARRCARPLEAMQFELEDATFDGYSAKLAERGGVVEERIKGDDFMSPSVQLRVTPLGDVRAALDARPAARRAERPVVPRVSSSRPTSNTPR